MKSICAIEGVRTWGIREGKYGLSLIAAEGTVAGVLTRNLVRAGPIEAMVKRIQNGRLAGVIVNSGCANAYTGELGYQNAEAMAAIGAEALGTTPDLVGIASTGVIGRHLDLDRIRRQAAAVALHLSSSEEAEVQAARAIMTTDLVEKHALIRGDGFSVAGICKGSGMIAPNMGTMLAFLYTDATVEAGDLQLMLAKAVNRSFNRIVVDGDTSTNDIALCTATNRRGAIDPAALCAALEACCQSLAIQIAADGEGATKLIEMTVSKAPTEEEAATVAKTIIESPLVKTAVYGEDPNWGRIVAAAGRAGVAFDPARISLSSGEGTDRVPLVRDGMIVVDLAAAKAGMQGKKVVFELELNAGTASATAWGCDLTEKYVEINGRYTT